MPLDGFFGIQIAQNSISAGALPRIPLGIRDGAPGRRSPNPYLAGEGISFPHSQPSSMPLASRYRRLWGQVMVPSASRCPQLLNSGCLHPCIRATHATHQHRRQMLQQETQYVVTTAILRTRQSWTVDFAPGAQLTMNNLYLLVFIVEQNLFGISAVMLVVLYGCLGMHMTHYWASM